MPIEIRELVIRTTMQEEGSQSNQQGSNGSPSDMEKLVAECVHQVMQLIKDQTER